MTEIILYLSDKELYMNITRWNVIYALWKPEMTHTKINHTNYLNDMKVKIKNKGYTMYRISTEWLLKITTLGLLKASDVPDWWYLLHDSWHIKIHKRHTIKAPYQLNFKGCRVAIDY